MFMRQINIKGEKERKKDSMDEYFNLLDKCHHSILSLNKGIEKERETSKQ
jgi:hypothetical protein